MFLINEIFKMNFYSLEFTDTPCSRKENDKIFMSVRIREVSVG